MEFVVSKNYRSAYHFQPPKNWMNDPNAPMYYKGHYHLFYQYNPDAAVWIPALSWGHSVSTDLIHWTGIGLALTPSDPFDINGCWSGSATLLPGDKPVILYTGLDTDGRQVQNVAYPKDLSDPLLSEWTKPDHNPIIEPFEGLNVTSFRDPTTAWLGQDGLWRILVGAELNNDGHAILYKSKDFVNWVRANDPLHCTIGSGMWECPDFFPLGEGKYVLKISFYDTFTEHYIIGRYDEERDVFVGEHSSSNDFKMWPRVDHGRFYASKSFEDEKKRRILWGWSNEADSKDDATAKGWAGVQTIPRVVSLDASGKQLVQWPIEEIESLRGKHIHLTDIDLKPGVLVEIKGLTASQADVEVEFELDISLVDKAEPFEPNWLVDPPKLCHEKRSSSVDGGVGPFGLFVLASHGLEEYTAIYFKVFNTGENNAVVMCTDQRKSSVRDEVLKPALGGIVDMDFKKDGKISLRTLIDHSIVESFGGGGKTVITSRVYPTLLPTSSTHMYAFNYGTETVKISEFNGWNMENAQIS